MKRKRCVYELQGRKNGFIKVWVLPKHQRHAGVDGIQLQYQATNAKKYEAIEMKDWEALAIIEGLTRALLYKRDLR